MKYFNIKRYKFSTITRSLGNTIARSLGNLVHGILNLLQLINFKKIFNYFYDIRHALKKAFKYLDPRKYNILSIIKKIKIKNNKFLFFHLPASIVFFGLLYLIIPTFYTYDKLAIQKIICMSNNFECIVKGKVSYNFFPTPKLKVKDLIINIPSSNTNLLSANNVYLRLSFKNLLAKNKHEVKNIVFSDFEISVNLKKLRNYNTVFENKISFIPIVFRKGEIVLYDEKNYVATINKANLIVKFLKDSFEGKLAGKFLNDSIIINFNNKIEDNKPATKIELKMKDSNFYTKVSFFNSYKNINKGKFLVKQDKNKISGIFDYKDSQIKILKSNIRNSYIDGKLIGNIIFLPYFDFNLDLNLNSVNFTRLYNYFLSLDELEQKKIFKINNKINGKLNFSSEKVYSKHNLVKTFESRIKFYNGNIKIEQFLINLGKLGAADILGKIYNDKDSINFKFESNVFVDNEKKFLSKFGIYNKKSMSSSLFIRGNFDLENIRASFYEISGNEKFNTEDINFIESEFNDLIFEKGFEDLFNFQKFKVFLKSARDEKN